MGTSDAMSFCYSYSSREMLSYVIGYIEQNGNHLDAARAAFEQAPEENVMGAVSRHWTHGARFELARGVRHILKR